MRITYYGQACLLIEVGGKKILTDPWLTEGAYFGTWFHTHLLAQAGVTPETFPKNIDYIFLSHEHQDHVDPMALRQFSCQTPVLICKFATPKFRRYVESCGFTDIHEVPAGQQIPLSEDVNATIFGTAEYTNDAALLVEAEGCRVFNETDCKLGYSDLRAIGNKGIDIGFYMFSGANWYPIMYDYPEAAQRELVARRRSSLLRSFVERVKLTKPKIAVPSAGPCTVLDPDRLWLNTPDRGIFIDPHDAIKTLKDGNLASQPITMAATDVWDSNSGVDLRAPSRFRIPRAEYIREASETMAPVIAAQKKTETPAGRDLPQKFMSQFNEFVASQSELVRRRINAKVGFVVSGPHGGSWTLDFTSRGPDYVHEGLKDDWTYKLEIEDNLLWSFLTRKVWFFEDLLLSLRVRCSRRPDTYNEALYHFLYEPDPEKLHNWYAKS